MKESKSLEEEVNNYIQKEFPDGIGFPNVPKIARYFAEWQKQEMMKDAVEAIVCKELYSKYVKERDDESLSKVLENYNPGDKIRIIIVKKP